MQVEFTGTGVSPDVEEYIKKRVAKLDRFFSKAQAARVEFNHYNTRHSGKNYRIEITVDVARKFVRAEEYGQSFEEACDLAVEKVEKQLRRHKTKLIEKYRKGEEETAVIMPIPPEENGRKVARVKRFKLKPMDTEEAILQLDLSGHDFFIYSEQASGAYHVLYKRSDGTLGLLVPEV